MSTPYEYGGRSAQKSRTRAALVAAARQLIASGERPTVAGAAAAASISRTTAYRYFPDERALLVAAHPEIAATTMLPPEPPTDTGERLDAVVRNFSEMILDTELQQRMMLHLSLDPDPAKRTALPLRQGRAIAWITEALDGLDEVLSRDQLEQLVRSIRATIGIEAIVWLTDVAGLTNRDAIALTRWSAQALLRHATTDAPPVPATAPTRPHPPNQDGPGAARPQ